jgi:hypothetical protein
MAGVCIALPAGQEKIKKDKNLVNPKLYSRKFYMAKITFTV